MNYQELNDKHQSKMLGLISPDSEMEFEWVDDSLENRFLKLIPEVHTGSRFQDINSSLNNLIYRYNHKTLDDESLLKEKKNILVKRKILCE